MSLRNIGITIVLLACVAVAYLSGRNSALNEELQQKQPAGDVTITQPDGALAPVVPTIAPQKLTNAKPATPAATPEPRCDVIGNKNSGIYHVPGCRSYDRVREYNREYFCSEEEAQEAGYRKARNC